ncbi:MAG: ankyrin repeat domain-containing protein [Cellvibrio sp.]|uniref:ankyrin repeat domain-containing protein n=1 Tax=Cellvibrio sp. TaxID=1965322 RepID=UPI0031A50912
MIFFVNYQLQLRLLLNAMFVSFVIGFPVGTVANAFEPYIIEGDSESLCGLALDHYRKAFRSNQTVVTELVSEEIKVPEFTITPLEQDAGVLQMANIAIDGKQLILAYHKRMHSWRGDIYSGYLVSHGDLPDLVRQLETGGEAGAIKPFYPAAGGFAWIQEIPFEYKGNWFLTESGSNFDENNGLRNVFSVDSAGGSTKVCAIKIFDSFDVTKIENSSSLPFFSAYVKSMERIMLSPGHCGTSHPEVGAARNGRLFVSQAIYRPWSLKFEQERYAPSKKLLQEHFDQWRYGDMWSYRERDVLENLRIDAQLELSQYLQSKFSYAIDMANNLAASILQEMNIRYYSLASFENTGVDFSRYQQLVDGSFTNWALFVQEISDDEQKIIFPAFSLIVDNSWLIETLPQRKKAENFLTQYDKDLLMVAAHMNNYDAVKYLVDQGWSLERVTVNEDDPCWNGPSRVNRSALTYAVENGSLHLINYLIKAGANPAIIDSEKNDLQYYLQKNPRFTQAEKGMGLSGLLKNMQLNSKISPSYSCNGNLNIIEKTICSSEGLSIYDVELRNAYKKAISINSVSAFVKKSQIRWIGERGKSCGKLTENRQLTACIAQTTRARIRYLESLVESF